ncbi:MAG: hypothetical protein O2923_01710 [Verrucomicrobia bacterium]|nr:hypothetical protein [Verrucomicrobiota bacterium]MDA1085667.1 hypothetical protein [Verrucomicrobiota bacterium]
MALISGLQIASPYTYQQLAIYPLVSQVGSGRTPQIFTLSEAMHRGWIEITESSRETVSELSLINRGPHHVLAMGGELIEGGKQNRTVRQDVLLPPQRVPIILPVFCIEKERWSSGGSGFKSADALAHPRLRREAASGASQDRIWQEVDDTARSLKVTSATRDYTRIAQTTEVRRQADEVAGKFARFAPRSTVGMVAVAHGRIMAADVFTDADLFARERDSLCRSYAVEYATQAGRPGRDKRSFRRPERPWPGTATIRTFLLRALDARYTSEGTPGVGRVHTLSRGIGGVALTWQNCVIHAGLYP